MNIVRLRKTWLMLVLLLACAPLAAQDYFAESDFFGESPIVLTVSRMHKPLQDSPASVTVIDREMIRNSGAREIADLFRMVPGMVVGYLLGHTPTVTYHGLGQEFHRQMQVLIDGRSVFVPSFGGVPWSGLPLLIEDIQRIEITRGPNAVTYGSNAFLATINIITRHAAEDVGGKLSASQQINNNGDVGDVYFRYGNQIDDLDWRISIGRETDDGYETQNVAGNDVILNDSKSLEKINLRTDFLTAHNQFWTIQAGLNQSTLGQGEGDPTDPLRDAESSNQYQNIRWELIEPQVQTTIKLTHTRHDFEDRFVAVNIPDFPADTTATIDFSRLSERTDLEIYQNRNVAETIALNYGASARHDMVQSVFLFPDNQKRKVKTNNLFSSLSWKPLSETDVDLGFLIEDSNITERETSYRISLIQDLGQHHLRLVSSTARRNPILWEQAGEISFFAQSALFVGPQPVKVETSWLNMNDIRPENITSHEIGLFSEFLQRRLTTDIKLFKYRISDQIIDTDVPLNPPLTVELVGLGVIPVDDETSTVINGGTTTVEGVELSFNYNPLHDDFRVYGGISQKHTSSFDKNLADSFPDRTGFIGGHYDISSVHQVSATQYYVDNMSTVDRTVQLDSFSRLDVRYQYTLDAKHEIKLEFIGYSVGGHYNDYRNSMEHQETYLLRVSGRF